MCVWHQRTKFVFAVKTVNKRKYKKVTLPITYKSLEHIITPMSCGKRIMYDIRNFTIDNYPRCVFHVYGHCL